MIHGMILGQSMLTVIKYLLLLKIKLNLLHHMMLQYIKMQLFISHKEQIYGVNVKMITQPLSQIQQPDPFFKIIMMSRKVLLQVNMPVIIPKLYITLNQDIL